MQVKTFSAETMPEALKLVKQDLGADALILSTRRIKKGLLRLNDGGVEVVAAIEEDAPDRADHPDTATEDFIQRINHKAQPYEPPAFPTRNPQLYTAGDASKPQKRMVEILGEDPKNLRRNNPNLALPPELMDRLDEIKEVKHLLRRLDKGSVNLPQKDGQDLPEALLQFSNTLEEQGINDEASTAINEVLLKSLSEEEIQNEKTILSAAEQFLTHLFKDFQGSAPHQGQRRIALVGPTGVGKTTTLAKLAADSLINQKLKIALITIDIYRIAATEQLKVYGEIMNIPVDVVVSPIQLAQTLARHKDKDLILIDTAGRSPRDTRGIEEMARFLGPDMGTENHLVMSAATRERELFKTRARFSGIPIHRMIFTKLDECEEFGVLLNFFIKNQIPLSYLTHGQKVPEDIMPADPRETARLILGQ